MTESRSERAARIIVADVLEGIGQLPDESVDCVVTSPPYLDARPEYDTLAPAAWKQFFPELRRVTKGPALLNVGRLWRDGRELRWWVDLLTLAEAGGWDHVDTLMWVKQNANPIKGRYLSDAHELVLILGDAARDDELNVDAVRTPYAPGTAERMARRWINGRGVKGDARATQHSRAMHPLGARPKSWVLFPTGAEKGNPHPAPMAPDLAEHLVKLASWEGQTVLDPFLGSGTTALVALRLGRDAIGIELNPEYARLAERRCSTWWRKPERPRAMPDAQLALLDPPEA